MWGSAAWTPVMKEKEMGKEEAVEKRLQPALRRGRFTAP